MDRAVLTRSALNKLTDPRGLTRNHAVPRPRGHPTLAVYLAGQTSASATTNSAAAVASRQRRDRVRQQADLSCPLNAPRVLGNVTPRIRCAIYNGTFPQIFATTPPLNCHAPSQQMRNAPLPHPLRTDTPPLRIYR